MFELFDEIIDYPENIAETGVPQNTCFKYVSNTFLNGLINYTNPFYVIVLERYEDWKEHDIDKQIEQVNKCFHTDYGIVGDDIIVLSETINSYWLFWSDKDCSDCIVGRIEKKISKEKFKKELIKYVTSFPYFEREKNTEAIIGNYKELPMPTGWTKF